MRPRPSFLAILASLAVAGAGVMVPVAAAAGGSAPPAGSSGDLPGLAELEALEEAPAECPIDLAGAARAAGLELSGEVDVEVDVGRPLPPESSIPIDDLTALDMAGGVVVECDAQVGEDDVSVLLHASPNERATMGTFLPLIAVHGAVDSTHLQSALNRMFFTPIGELVDLEGLIDGPIAVARPAIDGAADATLVVFADSDDGDNGGSTAPEEAAIDVTAIAAALIGSSHVVVSEDEFVAAAARQHGLSEEQARCVYAALDGDVAELLDAGALDLSGERLAQLTNALALCAGPAATA